MQEEANMVNLTGNGGGYMPIASEWWENYVGETVPTNHFSIYTQQNMGTKGFVGMEDEMGVQVMDGWTLVNTHPDSFIENENYPFEISPPSERCCWVLLKPRKPLKIRQFIHAKAL